MHLSHLALCPALAAALTLLALAAPVSAQAPAAVLPPNIPVAAPPATAPPGTVPPGTTPPVGTPPPAVTAPPASPNGIVLAPPLLVPPPAAAPPYQPLPSLPPAALDNGNDAVGIAQQMTRAKGLQARIIWIDGTANLNRVNTADKITALVAQIKKAGFNTIVFDVKPIVGYTLYPSKYAPKLTTWFGGKTLPLNFDPLAAMVTAAHANGLQLVTSMNVFSEGHRDVKYGPGYDHPEWQTTLCEPSLTLMSSAPGAAAYALSDRPNLPPRLPEQLALYTDAGNLKAQPGSLAAVLDANLRVTALADGAALPALSLSVPPGGSLVVGGGAAGQWLRSYAPIGAQMSLLTNSQLLPISAAARKSRFR